MTGFYDLSCLEAGGYTLEKEPVAVGTLVCELAAAFYADFTGAGREAVLELSLIHI